MWNIRDEGSRGTSSIGCVRQYIDVKMYCLRISSRLPQKWPGRTRKREWAWTSFWLGDDDVSCAQQCSFYTLVISGSFNYKSVEVLIGISSSFLWSLNETSIRCEMCLIWLSGGTIEGISFKILQIRDKIRRWNCHQGIPGRFTFERFHSASISSLCKSNMLFHLLKQILNVLLFFF